ncbi:TraR/DksA family transcriptional regulator [Desulfovibrio psychrotolerans]|uniref:Zinc finger DksA/TraR C4-type domain-containing protein n=1 Tax=Desulfovibrio psychrotolerans TaxID=415242 RepID=A0A7J0BZQ4_9BACT|nr:TraR/DksA C4-type zinc finger protein [Desulfovibrio psychrotolerans]GFM38621.1 hypothetical protein DSM19430T_33050 [Desulfovibrio psychrotolerans]
MTESQRREIERHLEDTLAALRVQAHMDSTGDLCCADENEFASRLSEMRLSVALQARVNVQIRETEEALRRLDVADFGTCRECGEDIPLQRLKANPTTTLCVHCRQERDNAPRHMGMPVAQAGLRA